MKKLTKILLFVYEIFLILLLTYLFLLAMGNYLRECDIGINQTVRNMSLLLEYLPLSLFLLSSTSPLIWWLFHRLSLRLPLRLLFSVLIKVILLSIPYVWFTTQANADYPVTC